MQAIENGYGLDYNGFNSNEIRRFGDLLSSLFMKEWDKFDKPGSGEDILHHFLTWPPFIQFVKIYGKPLGYSNLIF